MKMHLYGNLQEQKPILYLFMETKERLAFEEMYANTNFVAQIHLVMIDEFDWNGDLSPWPSEKLFKKADDFKGHASNFLEAFEKERLDIEKGISFSQRWIGGYSLAGLFALYSSIQSTSFQAVLSVSASLWYDNFVSYLKQNTVYAKKVYFSLGNKEAQSKNNRMAEVEICTKEIYGVLKQRGIETTFEWNEGGHFQDPEARILKGIQWLLKKKN
ncbi:MULTISPECIES: hypothetical protein [Terrabacteria group]|uniref:hypothetical protein n=1 Tax=Bacillati TaxID=1783272 RepID=UPI001C6ECD55|nr:MULTISPECIES: hypothetical protein [Terrabacteria group]MBW9212163.1 hypothetical protein [Trueperella sp. zg.1013]